jgi:hypothetical protein
MKRFLIGILLAAVAAIGFGGVGAFASNNAKLQTFGTGTVAIGSDGTSATIVNGPGEFGGVFLNAKNNGNKPLSAINFSFVSTGDVAGGAPRFSIPIDTDGVAGTVEGYAFLDAAGCGATVGSNTTVSTTVSTASETCAVNFMSVDYGNWSALATAHPDYRLAAGAVPFIIADQPGNYAVNSIDLR